MISLAGRDHSGFAQAAESGPAGRPSAGSDLQIDEIADAVRELDERAVVLPPGSPLGFEDTVFEPLDPALARARVVGLGEATHGTAEFFELKHRLFRHLVEVHGHRALGYEVNFAASLALDRYVATGEGSLDGLLGDLLFIQANEEVRALLEWLREHNRGLPDDERVRFIGIDSQLDMWNLELHRAIFSARFPLVYADLETRFDVLAELGKIDYRSITPGEIDRIRSVLDDMAVVVEGSTRGMGRRDVSIAAHLVEAMQRSHEFLASAYRGDNNVRDGHLAANALWIAELLGDDVPYSVWAHNSHIGSDPSYYGDNGPGSMGYDLTRRLGRDYFRIGTAFTRGSFVALRGDWRGRDTTAPLVCRLDEDPPADSVNAVLDRASHERFYIRLREIPEGTPLYRFFEGERSLLGVGDFFAGEAEPHYRSP
ncbi:MAG: erythromycin esterase family protein, partial [Candidatus Sulfomarinibacteraceae bacterium]